MLPNLLQRAFATPLRYLLCASLAVGLSACGGGGGNASTPDPKPAVGSISLSSSAATIDASGTDGTEVTVTAIIKDSANSAMSGVVVSFSADSGTISNTARTTGANGTIIEKLSVKGDSSLRPIKITASAGSATSNQITVTVVPSPAAPKLLLTALSGTLPSAGGVDVQIRALVINANNVVVPNATVSFSTDSGSLTAAQGITNASGFATVSLGTGTDPTNRAITVTATVPGTPASIVTVNVVGTKLTVNASPTLNAGAVSDVTTVLVDSTGEPLANRSVSFKSVLNTLKVKGSGAGTPGITDSAGKLVLSYTAATAGIDTITVTAFGETATAQVTTVSSNFTVVADGVAPQVANTNACTGVSVSNFLNNAPVLGTVTLSASRGLMYSDSLCTTPLGATPLTLVAGLTKAYISANSPGIATISATSSVTNSTAQGLLEIVAPLNASAILTLQATPSVVGVNTPLNSNQQSVLRAVVTDKSQQGNPVKNAKVAFSIVSDPSGGSLSQPAEVLTGADGSATVSYIAGTTATAKDGVLIQAVVQSPLSTASNTVKLTVAQQPLTIGAGTGNTILTPNSATYAVDYVVVVADSAGNPVRDVTLTGSIRPRNYRKGEHTVLSSTSPWAPVVRDTCPNEDVDGDGVLTVGEDINNNGRLDPGLPLTISAKSKTDATGTAIVQILYPRDRAYWLDVDFTITAAVSGSEGRYVGYTLLLGLADDYKNALISPPGVVSPYGKFPGCNNTN
jgi:hypothetical protein